MYFHQLFKNICHRLFYSEPLFNQSVILSGKIEYDEKLKQWIGGTLTVELCWRATRDGWAAKTFHSNCDEKISTVTIVKVGDYLFGGYATASWSAQGKMNRASNL